MFQLGAISRETSLNLLLLEQQLPLYLGMQTLDSSLNEHYIHRDVIYNLI